MRRNGGTGSRRRLQTIRLAGIFPAGQGCSSATTTAIRSAAMRFSRQRPHDRRFRHQHAGSMAGRPATSDRPSTAITGSPTPRQGPDLDRPPDRLSATNFFDLRGYYFNVQREDSEEEIPDALMPTPTRHLRARRPVGAGRGDPVLDHNYIFARPILGGQLRFDSTSPACRGARATSATRPLLPSPYYAGVAGAFTPARAVASWEGA